MSLLHVSRNLCGALIGSIVPSLLFATPAKAQQQSSGLSVVFFNAQPGQISVGTVYSFNTTSVVTNSGWTATHLKIYVQDAYARQQSANTNHADAYYWTLKGQVTWSSPGVTTVQDTNPYNPFGPPRDKSMDYSWSVVNQAAGEYWWMAGAVAANLDPDPNLPFESQQEPKQGYSYQYGQQIYLNRVEVGSWLSN